MKIKLKENLYFMIGNEVLEIPKDTIVFNAEKKMKITPCCTYYSYRFTYEDNEIGTTKSQQRFIEELGE